MSDTHVPEKDIIILSSVAGGFIGLIPGDGIVFVGPEDPSWGKFIARFQEVLKSVNALSELSIKQPPLRSKGLAMAEELMAPHVAELNKFVQAHMPVHA